MADCYPPYEDYTKKLVVAINEHIALFKHEKLDVPPFLEELAAKAGGLHGNPKDPDDQGLHLMTVTQLKELAAQVGVDISGVRTKEEIIGVLEASGTKAPTAAPAQSEPPKGDSAKVDSTLHGSSLDELKALAANIPGLKVPADVTKEQLIALLEAGSA